MVDFLSNTGLVGGLIAFLIIILFLSLGVYLISAHFLQKELNKNHERVGRILFRVTASLLSLVLSLTFANQRVGYFTVKSSIEHEASKIVDVHVDLGMINTSESLQIQADVRDYIQLVISEEWIPLFDTPFDAKQFQKFLEIYRSANMLEAKTPIQERLKNNILQDLDEVSDLLQLRAYSTLTSSSPLLYTSFFGLVVTMILLGVYKPDKKTLLLSSFYITFIGAILYFVLMMSNPLRGPLKLDPGPFKVLKESVDKRYQ